MPTLHSRLISAIRQINWNKRHTESSNKHLKISKHPSITTAKMLPVCTCTQLYVHYIRAIYKPSLWLAGWAGSLAWCWWGDSWQCQAMSECCCFHCKIFPKFCKFSRFISNWLLLSFKSIFVMSQELFSLAKETELKVSLTWSIKDKNK